MREKYYVYVTNASNHNFLHEFDTRYKAEKFCDDASYHNSCYIIKGSDKQFYKRKGKERKIDLTEEPF